MKKKMLFILIGLGLFMFVGLTNVKAKTLADMTNPDFQIICEDTELEKGKTTKCHLIGQVINGKNDAGEDIGIHGVITKVSTKQLNIVNYKAGDGTDKFVADRKYNNQTFAAPASAYKCNTTGEECFGFFTAGDNVDGKFINTANVNIPGIDNKYNAYVNFGYYEVELAETATARECGEICANVYFAKEQVDYATNIASAGDRICKEIKPKIIVQPSTGSFVSIAIIVAGAIIAIGAVVVSKKNNKFYRV